MLLDVTRLHEPTRGVLAYHKAPTTPDVSQGIETAVREILKGADVPAKSISSLSIGTTAFINAVLEADGRRLAKVAVIRLCGPYTKQCPPFVDFPPRLRALTEGHVGYVDGGLQSASMLFKSCKICSSRRSVDGREILPLDEAQLAEQCNIITHEGLQNVCSRIFMSMSAESEVECTPGRYMWYILSFGQYRGAGRTRCTDCTAQSW